MLSASTIEVYLPYSRVPRGNQECPGSSLIMPTSPVLASNHTCRVDHPTEKMLPFIPISEFNFLNFILKIPLMVSLYSQTRLFFMPPCEWANVK